MILGIHCSVVRGFAAALDEALAAGCAAMQLLPYRRHHEPDPEENSAFRSRREKSPVRRLLAHSRFVPSLASAEQARRRRSVEMLALELRLSAALGAEAYILHAGAYSPGAGPAEGLRLAAEAIGEASLRSQTALPVLLENVPGGGRRMGGTLEQLADILAELRRVEPRAGVCLDTAHAWAAGHDIASAEGMLRFLSRVHRLLGADSVRAFHLNDTRALLGSHRENHSHWGEGYLGREGLRVLLERPEYASCPAILETPKEAGADRRNLEYLGGLTRGEIPKGA